MSVSAGLLAGGGGGGCLKIPGHWTWQLTQIYPGLALLLRWWRLESESERPPDDQKSPLPLLELAWLRHPLSWNNESHTTFPAFLSPQQILYWTPGNTHFRWSSGGKWRCWCWLNNDAGYICWSICVCYQQKNEYHQSISNNLQLIN